MSTPPPHDTEAEQSVIGAMLLSPSAIDSVADSLSAADFYRPAYATVFDTIIRLRDEGVKADAVTVSSDLRSRGLLESIGGTDTITKALTEVPAASSVRHYAEVVMQHAVRRRMINEGRELMERAGDMSLDVNDVLEDHQSIVATLGSTIIDHEPDDFAVEDFVHRTRGVSLGWTVENLIKRQHKIMVVGGEGSGKSYLLRFIAVCAAYGVHPFRQREMTPVRTLVIDLENPEDALSDSFAAILDNARKQRFQHDFEPVSRLWWRPAGLNLRNRVDAAEFENVIRARRPDLVCLGPLYAATQNSGSDFGWETAARELQVFLKKMMVRYDFSLLIEDHAPQSEQSGKRNLRPYGSSFWLRWPDIGITMRPINDDHTEFELQRFRGDRVVTDWPRYIRQGHTLGSPWPFVGRWE